MRLFYYKDPKGNFGDDINGWMWERLVPGFWTEEGNDRLCGIGTIIGLATEPNQNWTVFGSGVGYGPIPADFGKSNWQVACVRGPLTAAILGLTPDHAVCDAAIMVRNIPEFAPVPESERSGIVFMPHHHALQFGNWEEACRLAGIEFISPREDSVKTLNRIRHAKLVVADAMHLAIMADTVRVPWIPVTTSTEISTFKWTDWSMSLKVPYKPVSLPPSTPTEAARSMSLGMRGQKQVFQAEGIDAALAWYRAFDGITKSKIWPVRSKVAGSIYTKLLHPIADAVPEPLRRKTVENAARALQKASQGTAYLSDDSNFDRALTELSSRLEKLRMSRS